MARPAYTARRREALLIVRNEDGMLEVGKGRVRIARGEVSYFRRVTMAVAQVLDLPGGAEAFERGDELGHRVTIMQPPVPTVPPNAWTLPRDITAATAAGVPVGQTDANGAMLIGTGTGCASRIAFDPDDWPWHGDPTSPSSEQVLLNLLLQANAYAEGASMPPAGPANASAIQGQLRLSCRPTKVADVLFFPYLVENLGPDEVFVMDAMACPDPATRAAGAAERSAVLIGRAGDAIVGTYVPPMPADRHMAMPVIPLARRLARGGVLEHKLEITAPYAETSPWLPDPAPEQHSATGINGIVLAVGYWPVGMPGLVAAEAAYAPGLYSIAPACGGATASMRFPTTGLKFSRRTDLFPRSMA